MSIELKDWLNSINLSKSNLIDEDPSLEKEYPTYIINRCFSGHLDAIMFANEMNMNPFLQKKLQYDFLLNTLRTKKRYSPWLRKDTIKDLDLVKRYYGYSNEKAKQALRILTQEQLDFIKSKLFIALSKFRSFKRSSVALCTVSRRKTPTLGFETSNFNSKKLGFSPGTTKIVFRNL